MRQISASRLSGSSPLIAAMLCLSLPAAAAAQDPLASNNGLYPSDNWRGRFLLANLDYPGQPEQPGWPFRETAGPLSQKTAPAYALRLKAHLGLTLATLVDRPDDWDPVEAGWYDMVWSGEGTVSGGVTDPTSGREALMNSYSGQIMPAVTFPEGQAPQSPVQNHAVIYYNAPAAAMLGRVWADLYAPDLKAVGFPEGSVVVKVEAVTNTPEDWPVLENSSVWHVFRPTTEDQLAGGPNLRPQVLPVRPLQMAVRVKDSTAAQGSGWVFAVFVYDRDAPGTSAWERFVPLGLQWGNDPDVTGPRADRFGRAAIRQSWINPAAPAFTRETFGWGGRLSGPMDVSSRHNVILPSGERYVNDQHVNASSCQSCHGTAEFPRAANLYPSPNRSFPRDDLPFLLYEPGSPEWMRWFQNRPGSEPMTRSAGVVALDYDMALMFAVSAYNEVAGNARLEQETFDVH
ncbi:hypothetical protein [Paracoccus binzhouensis]|uniref:hypothetical protein n=1 Tax=Paracoccus binzhouensis TaxID=2796149 RepID=UPI0018EF2C45|nr:hypothetical protein [Paracoccus binzhouensis]